MKHLNNEELKVLVRARATKGSAFMKVNYEALQQQWKDKLEPMSRDEIFKTYPSYTYDIKQ